MFDNITEGNLLALLLGFFAPIIVCAVVARLFRRSHRVQEAGSNSVNIQADRGSLNVTITRGRARSERTTDIVCEDVCFTHSESKGDNEDG